MTRLPQRCILTNTGCKKPICEIFYSRDLLIRQARGQRYTLVCVIPTLKRKMLKTVKLHQVDDKLCPSYSIERRTQNPINTPNNFWSMIRMPWTDKVSQKQITALYLWQVQKIPTALYTLLWTRVERLHSRLWCITKEIFSSCRDQAKSTRSEPSLRHRLYRPFSSAPSIIRLCHAMIVVGYVWVEGSSSAASCADSGLNLRLVEYGTFNTNFSLKSLMLLHSTAILTHP